MHRLIQGLLAAGWVVGDWKDMITQLPGILDLLGKTKHSYVIPDIQHPHLARMEWSFATIHSPLRWIIKTNQSKTLIK